MAHGHSVKDADKHFVINPSTRAIENNSDKVTLMQYDHNSEVLSFELPKMIDGHDMTQCNVVQVHYINIDASTKQSNKDIYEISDLEVSLEDENKVVMTWLISQNATQYAGTLNFIVKFKCVVNGVTEYVWNTDIYKGISISNGIDNSETVAKEYVDILEKWKLEVLGGLPEIFPADNDKIVQIVDGKMAYVAVKDSAVAAYIDEYINSALEGDY